MSIRRQVFAVLLLVGFLPTQSFAALLNLARGLPDIYSVSVVWDYAGSTGAGDFGAFTGNGELWTIVEPSAPATAVDIEGTYQLSFGIDSTGAFDGSQMVGGVANLVMNGRYFGTSDAFQDLLTANITLFGDPSNDTLEFLAVVTGGIWADKFGGVGARIGSILNDVLYPGAGTSSWDGTAFTSTGNSDTFVELVPVPGSLMLFGLGGLLAAGVRRRRLS